MKIVKNIKQIDEYLADREPSEIIENAETIIDLIDNDHVGLNNDGAFVAQSLDSGEVIAWDLIDWYMGCDTDSEFMTSSEIQKFVDLGGEVRT